MSRRRRWPRSLCCTGSSIYVFYHCVVGSRQREREREGEGGRGGGRETCGVVTTSEFAVCFFLLCFWFYPFPPQCKQDIPIRYVAVLNTKVHTPHVYVHRLLRPKLCSFLSLTWRQWVGPLKIANRTGLASTDKHAHTYTNLRVVRNNKTVQTSVTGKFGVVMGDSFPLIHHFSLSPSCCPGEKSSEAAAEPSPSQNPWVFLVSVVSPP